MIFEWLNRLLGSEPTSDELPGAVDHGGGLYRLPDPRPETGMIFDAGADTWVPVEVKAAETLAAYREGRWSSEGDRCPACSEVVSLGNAAFLARNHPLGHARRRWSRNEDETRLMIEALGPCLCGQDVTETVAWESAKAFNTPYLGRMAMGS